MFATALARVHHVAGELTVGWEIGGDQPAQKMHLKVNFAWKKSFCSDAERGKMKIICLDSNSNARGRN